MKRLALSVLGGFLIPFTYTMIVGPLSTYVGNRRFNKFLMLPVRWPMIPLENLVSMDFLHLGDRFVPVVSVYLILADVTLYSFLTYLLLWRFWKRRPKATAPPEPPQFAAE